jgi:hypothetical protein
MSFFGKFKTGTVSKHQVLPICCSAGYHLQHSSVDNYKLRIKFGQLTSSRIFTDTERFSRTTTCKEGP